MIRFEQLKNKPAMLKCLTGLTIEGFLALIPSFEAADVADLAQQDAQRGVPRQRERGTGQKGALPNLTDKLVFILFYFWVSPGFFRPFDDPQFMRWHEYAIS